MFIWKIIHTGISKLLIFWKILANKHCLVILRAQFPVLKVLVGILIHFQGNHFHDLTTTKVWHAILKLTHGWCPNSFSGNHPVCSQMCSQKPFRSSSLEYSKQLAMLGSVWKEKFLSLLYIHDDIQPNFYHLLESPSITLHWLTPQYQPASKTHCCLF